MYEGSILYLKILESLNREKELFIPAEFQLAGYSTYVAHPMTAYLLACYGATRSFYFWNDERILVVNNEWDALLASPTPCLFSISTLRQLEESKLMKCCTTKRDRKILLDTIFGSDIYIVFIPLQIGPRFRKIVQNVLTDIRENGLEPYRVLVVPNAVINEDWDCELLEFITGLFLAWEGYLLTSYNPIGLGADLYAYRNDWYGNGAFLMELVLGTNYIEEGDSKPSAIIIENEAKNRVLHREHGISQVRRYLSEGAGAYERGYVSAPLMDEYMIDELKDNNIGLVTCDRNGKLSWWYPKKASHTRSPEMQQQILGHLDEIIENLPSLGLEVKY